MSLIAWFPFQGDINNYGCGDALCTANGSYSFNNTAPLQTISGSLTISLVSALAPSLTQSYSIGLWVPKALTGSTSNRNIRNGAINDIYYNTTGLQLALATNSTYITPSSQSNISFGTQEFVYCVGVWNAKDKTKKTYINGKLEQTSKYISGPFNYNYSDISIQDVPLADLKIYDHALSLKEVQENYKLLLLDYRGINQHDNIIENSGMLFNMSLVRTGSVPVINYTDDNIIALGTSGSLSTEYLGDMKREQYTVAFQYNNDQVTKSFGLYFGPSYIKIGSVSATSGFSFNSRTTETAYGLRRIQGWHYCIIVFDASDINNKVLKVYYSADNGWNSYTSLLASDNSFYATTMQPRLNIVPEGTESGTLLLKDIRVYGRALNNGEVKQVFEGAAIDDKLNFYCTEYLEDKEACRQDGSGCGLDIIPTGRVHHYFQYMDGDDKIHGFKEEDLEAETGVYVNRTTSLTANSFYEI